MVRQKRCRLATGPPNVAPVISKVDTPWPASSHGQSRLVWFMREKKRYPSRGMSRNRRKKVLISKGNCRPKGWFPKASTCIVSTCLSSEHLRWEGEQVQANHTYPCRPT